ncbi:MAG: type II secretion system F family protein [Kangiellaceae bacterium]
MSNTPPPANLFFDLATLISAGIPSLDAAKKVNASYPDVEQWSLAIAALEKGSRLSLALNKAQLISQYQTELISVSEDAGRLEQALKRLAEDVDNSIQRQSKLKSKLLYPFAILIVGILLSSVLSFVQHPQEPLVVLLLILVLKLLFGFWIFRTVLYYSRKGIDFWLSKLDAFQNSAWFRQHFQMLLFEVLYWHTSSGIDPKTSFSRISKLIASPTIKKKLLKASNLCGQGVAISNALRQAKLPLSSDALQLFSAGEHAGDIEGTLKKQLEIFEFETNLALDNLTEWLPRIFYGLVVVFAISAVL